MKKLPSSVKWVLYLWPISAGVFALLEFLYSQCNNVRRALVMHSYGDDYNLKRLPIDGWEHVQAMLPIFIFTLIISLPFFAVLPPLILKIFSHFKIYSRNSYIAAGALMGLITGIIAWKVELLGVDHFWQSSYFFAGFLTPIICAIIYWCKVVKPRYLSAP